MGMREQLNGDTMYIHFDLESSMWIMTENEIEGSDLYVCDQAVLANCTEGTWTKTVRGTVDVTLSFEVLETARLEACKSDDDEDDDETSVNGVDSAESGGNGDMALIVVIIALSLIVLGCICLFVWQRTKAKKGQHSFKNTSVPTNTNADTVGATLDIGTDEE